ncbi:ATP-dependent DNA helicase Mph1p [[Candida] railenensis]|uniref:ATP-dependent DNA helicase n=1 Tax=[Candida] railenensis TaxID=45579 RepID=A0A9P0QQ26_9ASCO|nr:ATP-dependent DNA helicase Mph1p [[Candida] railenensis]
MSDVQFSDESDDDIFNDTIDNETIDHILNKPSLQQRDLYGAVVPEYIDNREKQKAPPRVKTVFPPTHHFIDYDNIGQYIYPTNFEVRDYQFNIVKNSFYSNILVALPTGLGKTFIASTVILNFNRWFPKSKIIFMAPTRPLVAQQIKACCGTTGISTSIVATLLDKTKRNRQEIWDSKSIFFTTPQVVENDLSTGVLDPKSIVLLVIDEAHRSKGNYAYNNVVKYLNRFQNHSFRILSLTATPASDIEGVQEIIDNLQISKVEIRTENSIDVSRYLMRKKIERFNLGNSVEIEQCIEYLNNAIEPVLKLANERKIYDMRDPSKINAFQVMEASQRLLKNPNIPEGLKWSNYFILQLLNIVGQSLRRLVVYGVRSFYTYFLDKHKAFVTKFNNKKSNNKMAAGFYFHDDVKRLLNYCENAMRDPKFLGHPKLEVIVSQLTDFFGDPNNSGSRCIIFTEFRESALTIVKTLENQHNEHLKPHIFIGQAKEKEKFDEVKFMSKSKKKNTETKKGKKKDDDDGVDRTSSEDAQMKGMNQKIQKEVIHNFKEGEYNVLVATSIGEEGLDIGEVDLIICYDSTSSPIKNIQRMGRTGRKRNGKVILLFSSNEEQKFDKAMGGYEYIQQHIMNNNLIELRDSDRILPKQYTPIVKKAFIEIPDENLEIVKQEDEDEILRIATQYMKKGTKVSNIKKPQKAQKRFFLPENVDTGFTKAANLITKVGHTKDILDKIVSSSDEENELVIVEEKEEDEEEEHAQRNKSKSEIVSKRFAPKLDSEFEPRKRGTLGLKRYKQGQITDLMSTALQEKTRPSSRESDPTSEGEDVFDDGLDDELVTMVRASSTTPIPTSQANLEATQTNTIYENLHVHKNEFGKNEGFLNDSERARLYSSYYVSMNPSEIRTSYDPSDGLKNFVSGYIGHSKGGMKLQMFSGNYRLTRENSIEVLDMYRKHSYR